MYGTLNNGNLIPAPRRITLGEWTVINPTDEQYEAAGYLPVRYTDPPIPDEGYYPVSGWEEQDGEIVEVWAIVPNPEPTPDEALTRYANELTGKNDPDLVSATESLIIKFTEE